MCLTPIIYTFRNMQYSNTFAMQYAICNYAIKTCKQINFNIFYRRNFASSDNLLTLHNNFFRLLLFSSFFYAFVIDNLTINAIDRVIFEYIVMQILVNSFIVFNEFI